MVSLSKGAIYEIAAARLLCDVDGNGKVDRADLNLIVAAIGTAVAAGDPRDADHDGLLTIRDVRACTLKCTNAQCVP